MAPAIHRIPNAGRHHIPSIVSWSRSQAIITDIQKVESSERGTCKQTANLSSPLGQPHDMMLLCHEAARNREVEKFFSVQPCALLEFGRFQQFLHCSDVVYP